MVLWGPPGCGKTTIARLLAAAVDFEMVTFSAVLSGVKEARAIMAEASRRRQIEGRRYSGRSASSLRAQPGMRYDR